MTTFPNSPRLIKGGIVLIDPDTAVVRRIIVLQYNPDTLRRSFQPQTVKESGDRSEAMRLTGPPVETIKLDGAAGKQYRDKAYEAGWAGILRQSPQHGPKLKEFFAKSN